MTDLHTHILPGMDDGATDVQQSLVMLKSEAEQGVNTVALTPHFYPQRESVNSFLERRERAWQQLMECVGSYTGNAQLPALRLGAEVAYVPGMWEWPELPQLCYDGTKLLLVELPFTLWSEEIFRELYHILGCRGITPMIAHQDRYIRLQKPKYLRMLMDMELPYQVSVSAVLRHFSRREKELLLYGGIPVSDCHDTQYRPANLGKLQSFICCKYGKTSADDIVARTDIWNQM